MIKTYCYYSIIRKEEVERTNETFQNLKDRINDKNYELSIVYRKNLAYK